MVSPLGRLPSMSLSAGHLADRAKFSHLPLRDSDSCSSFGCRKVSVGHAQTLH